MLDFAGGGGSTEETSTRSVYASCDQRSWFVAATSRGVCVATEDQPQRSQNGDSSRLNHSILPRRLGAQQIADEIIPRPPRRVRRPLMPRIGDDQHVEVLPRLFERVHQAKRL